MFFGLQASYYFRAQECKNLGAFDFFQLLLLLNSDNLLIFIFWFDAPSLI